MATASEVSRTSHDGHPSVKLTVPLGSGDPRNLGLCSYPAVGSGNINVP